MNVCRLVDLYTGKWFSSGIISLVKAVITDPHYLLMHVYKSYREIVVCNLFYIYRGLLLFLTLSPPNLK